MKAGEVSALRERGLRRVGGAEPPSEAVTPWTDLHPNNRQQPPNLKRKADTTKTYLLKNPACVEPKAGRKPPLKKSRTGRPARRRATEPLRLWHEDAGLLFAMRQA
jgi:hypothetical protein